MKSIYELLNIRNVDIEKEIINAIDETKKELNGLATDRTCKIYSNKVSEILNKKNIVNRLVDTKTKDMDYSHQLVIVPKDDNYSYIIDLTLSQFGFNTLYTDMYKKGYMLMNDEEFNSYLDFIEFNNLDFDSYIKNTKL